MADLDNGPEKSDEFENPLVTISKKVTEFNKLRKAAYNDNEELDFDSPFILTLKAEIKSRQDTVRHDNKAKSDDINDQIDKRKKLQSKQRNLENDLSKLLKKGQEIYEWLSEAADWEGEAKAAVQSHDIEHDTELAKEIDQVIMKMDSNVAKQGVITEALEKLQEDMEENNKELAQLNGMLVEINLTNEAYERKIKNEAKGEKLTQKMKEVMTARRTALKGKGEEITTAKKPRKERAEVVEPVKESVKPVKTAPPLPPRPVLKEIKEGAPKIVVPLRKPEARPSVKGGDQVQSQQGRPLPKVPEKRPLPKVPEKRPLSKIPEKPKQQVTPTAMVKTSKVPEKPRQQHHEGPRTSMHVQKDLVQKELPAFNKFNQSQATSSASSKMEANDDRTQWIHIKEQVDRLGMKVDPASRFMLSNLKNLLAAQEKQPNKALCMRQLSDFVSGAGAVRNAALKEIFSQISAHSPAKPSAPRRK